MAGNGLPKEVRRRLYSFGRKVASPFSASRRRRFLEDMIPGLAISGHVHLTKVARAISGGDTDIHDDRLGIDGVGVVDQRVATPRLRYFQNSDQFSAQANVIKAQYGGNNRRTT